MAPFELLSAHTPTRGQPDVLPALPGGMSGQVPDWALGTTGAVLPVTAHPDELDELDAATPLLLPAAPVLLADVALPLPDPVDAPLDPPDPPPEELNRPPDADPLLEAADPPLDADPLLEAEGGLPSPEASASSLGPPPVERLVSSAVRSPQATRRGARMTQAMRVFMTA